MRDGWLRIPMGSTTSELLLDEAIAIFRCLCSGVTVNQVRTDTNLGSDYRLLGHFSLAFQVNSMYILTKI